MENSTENIDGTKEKVVSITKNSLDKSLARDIVIKVTETLLPIVFWLGLITIVIFSMMTVGYGSFTRQVMSFFTTLIPTSLTFIVSFYIIYLLKDIRDSLMK